MKAVVHDRYGTADVLEMRDVEDPEVGHDDVLVRVRAAALNPADWHVMTGLPYIMRPGQLGLRPKVGVIGSDLAGQVEAVGPNVTRIRPGDEVYGQVDVLSGSGTVAEYARVPEGLVRPMPANLTPEQAAAVPLAATTALQGLRDVGQVQPGQRVLINGASGGVGTFAVQIAKALGADVTGVCSTRNVDLVRSLRADHVVDYTHEDVTRRTPHFDLVLDNVGNYSLTACLRSLKPAGTYVASFGRPENLWLGPMVQLFAMSVLNPFVSQRMVFVNQKPRGEDLDTLTELIETRAVTPVVDRTYPVADTRAAMEYLATGHARAKVIITIEES